MFRLITVDVDTYLAGKKRKFKNQIFCASSFCCPRTTFSSQVSCTVARVYSAAVHRLGISFARLMITRFSNAPCACNIYYILDVLTSYLGFWSTFPVRVFRASDFFFSKIANGTNVPCGLAADTPLWWLWTCTIMGIFAHARFVLPNPLSVEPKSRNGLHAQVRKLLFDAYYETRARVQCKKQNKPTPANEFTAKRRAHVRCG